MSVRRSPTTEELVKKLLVLILAAGAGYILWRKLNEDAEGRDLWSEVTDTVE
ncbi:DLW-39 family protein [Myceligenerans indicum]|uniref:Uncharacterized protein n=1 Tax=Myceligenerans indicum TaxID=2593663 RepID=A0ABS1LRD5_9MICO|nr:DLW-39 family protein [Myceligenerans indicum]MBL0888765.1 hypothetical protein [Myceligenerans indicum]